jgi:hypothetical protein
VRQVEHVQQTEDERETRGDEEGERADRETAQERDDEVLRFHSVRGGGKKTGQDSQHDDA